ncbi:MAG TPA: RHS repeat-associated core domain-containing protein, partial [Gemmatimonadaceae bacterium]
KWFGSIVEGKVDPSGLVYDRNRYYDPTAGRFTQEDPAGIGGGLNLYGYAGGDPANNTDPFGLCDDKKPWCELWHNVLRGMAVATSPEGGACDGPGCRTGALLGLIGMVAPTAKLGVATAAAAKISVATTIEDGVADIVSSGTKGGIRIMGDMSRDGTVITLDKAHIEGLGPGSSSVSEMRAVVQEFGRQQGATEVIINGAARTTGANPGSVPRSITVQVPPQ